MNAQQTVLYLFTFFFFLDALCVLGMLVCLWVVLKTKRHVTRLMAELAKRDEREHILRGYHQEMVKLLKASAPTAPVTTRPLRPTEYETAPKLAKPNRHQAEWQAWEKAQKVEEG